MNNFRIALAQINTTVGDLEENTAKVLAFVDRARKMGADLVSFPELTIPGYPPEDLLFKPQFIAENRACLDKIVEHSKDIAVVVGFTASDGDIYNSAAVIHDGELLGVYNKIFLPNYGVFDEKRYFREGSSCPVFTINGVQVGVNICEDIWYAIGPATLQRRAGAQVIVNINGSPYHRGKLVFREKMLATRASDNGVFVCYTNLVGGQDELVFDGASMVFDQNGELVARGKQFEEDLVLADLDTGGIMSSRLHESRGREERLTLPEMNHVTAPVIASGKAASLDKPPLSGNHARALGDLDEVYEALTIGTRDYVRKNGFRKVVIGLSGGIDSSLTATIATDALGSDNVVGVTMPSRYSSKGSKGDSEVLAKNLGIPLWTIPIEEPFAAFLSTLEPVFEETQPDVTEENLQARIRGNTLMAIANKFGWLVLTTGNKSELAMGYTTLYGDMAGGFAVIKDVPKTLVYMLAERRNKRARKQIIPRSVLEKEPSAELHPDQRDTDTLPPYPVLDPILEAYVEQDRSLSEIVDMGFDEETVKRVIRMVDRNEYKRRQAPVGIKITPRNFGRDRRMPIVNRYRGF
ncbi:MAG: NAD+ synthase [Dehalococcoidia bacterium]